MNDPLQKILAGVLCAGVLFFMADCSAGRGNRFNAVVAGKEYVPPSVTFDTDSEGRPQTHHHSAEYHVICIANGTDLFDVTTTRAVYHTLNLQEQVVVAARVGRWTGIKYLARVNKAAEGW